MNRYLLTPAALALLSLIQVSAADQPADPAAKPKPYPFDTCVVSGQTLGDMGEPYVLTQDGHEVKFCCKGCVKKFKANTATYVAVIDKGIEAKAAGKPAVNPAAEPKKP